MKKLIISLLLLSGIFVSNSSVACNGFTPTVTSNVYIGNGEYLLTVEVCEWVSNSETLNGNLIDWASIHGIIITVNGANIIGIVTDSISGATSGLTVYPTQTAPNQVEYGDWGNSNAPILLDYGDPQECWTIELIVDGPVTGVDVWGSSSESATQPGLGMTDNNGTWGCGSGLAVPPAVCDASWNPPTICLGSGMVDLDTTTLGTGVFSGPGVNSGNGMFDPTGLSGFVAVTFTVGDQFFNCQNTQNIEIIDLTPPSLVDTTICSGNTVDLDATVGPPPPPPPPPPMPCDFSIQLEDTYGDGWNGGSLTVYVNGSPVLTNITLGSGYGPATYNFTVMPGDVITVNYSGGSWQSENYYTVYDGTNGSGSVLYASTQGSIPPASQNITNNCGGGGGGGGNGASCDYTLVLDDSYGDGWNGADVDIYINGVLFQLNASVASCGGFGNVPCQNTITIPVSDGDIITLFYTGGSFDSENTLTMYDSDNIQVATVNNPPDGWLGGGITVSCPAPTYTYSWSPAGGLSDPNIANPTANVGSSTTYTVTVTQSGGCSQTSTVTVTIDPCGLAVDLLDFKGVCFENEIMLSWRTTSELENDYFIVEYSTTGSDFYEIGVVDGSGTTTSEAHYGFRHSNPSAIVNYYRLKQVDMSGNVNTYEATAVRCDENSITAYLNLYEQIVVTADAPILNVQLLDATGRTLYEGPNQIIDVSNHAATIFFLEIETTEFIARRKVINPR